MRPRSRSRRSRLHVGPGHRHGTEARPDRPGHRCRSSAAARRSHPREAGVRVHSHRCVGDSESRYPGVIGGVGIVTVTDQPARGDGRPRPSAVRLKFYATISVTFVVLMLAWELAGRTINPIFFAPLSDVAAEFIKAIFDPRARLLHGFLEDSRRACSWILDRLRCRRCNRRINGASRAHLSNPRPLRDDFLQHAAKSS